MKYSIVTKFIAVTLCAAALLGICAGAGGVLVLTGCNLYSRTVEDLESEQIEDIGQSLSTAVALAYASKTLGGCMSAAQIGKTDGFILNPIGYFMHYDPSPIMVLQPTIQMAETFSKDRLSPMLRDTPVLRDRVNDKARNSGNTILQKIFPGGHVTMVGANSPSSLASRPIRILLADEIDRYPATAGNEGDPLLLAGKRLTTFWNKKEVDVSTPTIKGLSRIEVEYEHSTQEEWNVPCPACGALTPLEWANIVFDRENLDEIGCVCPACGVLSSETEWKEHFSGGKFIAKYPERKVRGFHLNALASLFVEWREIVQKFLTANDEKKKGNIELLKV